MSIPLEYLLQKLVKGHQGHFLFSGVSSVSTRDADGPGVFKAEEGDGVGDRGSGNITSQCTDTLAGFLEHAPGIWMLKLPFLGYFPQLQKYQDFQIISFWIKGIQMYH